MQIGFYELFKNWLILPDKVEWTFSLTHLVNFNAPEVSVQWIICYYRQIDHNSLNNFLDLLSQESWDSVFSNNNVDTIYDNFINIYLKLFHACFPKKKYPTVDLNHVILQVSEYPVQIKEDYMQLQT